MGDRIQQLEIEKKEDEGQLQLLQTKVRHFETELPQDPQDKDFMNVQLEQENVILDTISLKDSIASLFTSTKSKDKTTSSADSQNKQQNLTKAKKETSLDHLNRVIKESDELAAVAHKLKDEQAQKLGTPPQS